MTQGGWLGHGGLKARYLKQRANYWALFVLWYQETGGGRFSCRTNFQKRLYYDPISLP